MDPVNELPSEIAQALSALEAEASRRAARLDVERVAARVVARLRQAPEGRLTFLVRMMTVPGLLRVAAAALVIVAAGTVTTVMVRHGTVPVAATLPLPEPVADSLDRTQAEALLRAVDELRAVNAVTPHGTSAVTVEDLSEQELRALLQAMQSSEEGTL